jgi:hypothetical protein
MKRLLAIVTRRQTLLAARIQSPFGRIRQVRDGFITSF